MGRSVRLLLIVAVLVLCAGMLFAAGRREAEPGEEGITAPVTVIIPAGPGGGTDLVTRIVANNIRPHLGYEWRVSNMPGGASVPAQEEVQRSDTDGHTLLLFHTMMHTTNAIDISPYTWENYEPIARVAMSPGIVAVHADSPWQSIQDLYEYGRDNPGELTYAMESGGTSHFLGVGIGNALGIDWTLAHIGGGSDRISALHGRHVDVIYEVVGAINPHIESGDFRGLAVLAEQRTDFAPGIPTMKEEGFDIVFSMPYYVFAPKGTPAATVAMLADAIEATVATDSVRQELANIDHEPAFLSGQALREVLRDEVEFINEWAQAID